MENRWENVEIVTDFLFLGFKITADGACSYESWKWLFLGRKAMTNLESMLKSRDITLPTKVHIVKTMVFPVVKYGCKSWTVKKAECQRIDTFKLWWWGKFLKSPLNSKEIKPLNLKGDQPWIFTDRLKLQYFGHLIRTGNSLEKSLMLEEIQGRRRRGSQRMRWLDGITDAMNVDVGKLQ